MQSYCTDTAVLQLHSWLAADVCGQFQSPALKSQRGPRSAEPYNATLLIGKSSILNQLVV